MTETGLCVIVLFFLVPSLQAGSVDVFAKAVGGFINPLLFLVLCFGFVCLVLDFAAHLRPSSNSGGRKLDNAAGSIACGASAVNPYNIRIIPPFPSFRTQGFPATRAGVHVRGCAGDKARAGRCCPLQGPVLRNQLHRQQVSLAMPPAVAVHIAARHTMPFPDGIHIACTLERSRVFFPLTVCASKVLGVCEGPRREMPTVVAPSILGVGMAEM